MKRFLIAIGLVVVVTGGLVAFVIRDSRADSARQTAEAPTVGFAATPVSFWNGDEKEEGHTLTFSWVDGALQVHTETMKEITWYRPERTYKVCYNPADPSDWKLYNSDHGCGS